MAERLVKSWLEGYLQYVENLEARKIFHLWIGVSVLSAAVRRNIWCDLGHFRVYPWLYILLVGPSGSKKTTAAGVGVNTFLSKVDGVRIARDEITPRRIAEWLAYDKIVLGKESLISNHSNKDKDKDKDKDNKSPHADIDHCGFIFAKEYVRLVGSQAHSARTMEMLTDAYDGGFLEYRTSYKGDIIIDNVGLSLLACSTPHGFGRALTADSLEDGYVSRMLLVYGGNAAKRVTFPTLSDEQKLLREKLLIDLQHIALQTGGFKLTNEAYTFHDNWYQHVKLDDKGQVQGYYQRKQVHILKLSTLLSISESDSGIIALNHIKNAMKMLNRIERDMHLALTHVALTDESRVGQQITSYLQIKGVDTPVSADELLEVVWQHVKSVKQFAEVMNLIEKAGLVTKVSLNGKPAFKLTKPIYVSEEDQLS